MDRIPKLNKLKNNLIKKQNELLDLIKEKKDNMYSFSEDISLSKLCVYPGYSGVECYYDIYEYDNKNEYIREKQEIIKEIENLTEMKINIFNLIKQYNKIKLELLILNKQLEN
jgi:hypothetical protein